jgi:hypothetical protein
VMCRLSRYQQFGNPRYCTEKEPRLQLPWCSDDSIPQCVWSWRLGPGYGYHECPEGAVISITVTAYFPAYTEESYQIFTGPLVQSSSGGRVGMLPWNLRGKCESRNGL